MKASLPALFLLLLVAAPAGAQPLVESGSTGALGPLAPSFDTTIPLPEDGVLHYTTVDIPVGVTVTFVRNADNTPVYLLASDDVVIRGTIDVSGKAGTATAGLGGVTHLGGVGGPGGSDGGSVNGTVAQFGLGPGGGGANNGGDTAGNGGASPIENGDRGVNALATHASTVIGEAYGDPGYVPLHGGSGGGGGYKSGAYAGSGGGGAIVIASSGTITIDGAVRANGGPDSTRGGLGGGGFIRLVAAEVSGAGVLEARGNVGEVCGTNFRGGCGGDGLIRVEAYDLTGALSENAAPGLFYTLPQAAVPYPPAERPRLTIKRANGKVPFYGAYFGHALQSPGVSLPADVTFTVELEARYVPTGYVAQVMMNAVGQERTVVMSTPLAGTFELSTATAEVTIPAGAKLGVLEAWLPNVPLPLPVTPP
ncbi:MAG: hypothetical protein KC635_01285 [Myxococcales bacterium]|nr:hypothetical protein [Myxococcales bacterium]MCB9734768.1 hypothetical protein [Deltaproteobacteria bacterium]